RYVPALLRLGAEARQVRQAYAGMQRHHQCMGAGTRQLLDDDCVEEEVGAGAAVQGGGVGAEEALRTHTKPDVSVARTAGVPPGDLRRDLVLDEAAHLLAEEVVVLGEDVAIHCHRSTRSNTWAEPKLARNQCRGSAGIELNLIRMPVTAESRGGFDSQRRSQADSISLVPGTMLAATVVGRRVSGKKED